MAFVAFILCFSSLSFFSVIYLQITKVVNTLLLQLLLLLQQIYIVLQIPLINMSIFNGIFLFFDLYSYLKQTIYIYVLYLFCFFFFFYKLKVMRICCCFVQQNTLLLLLLVWIKWIEETCCWKDDTYHLQITKTFSFFFLSLISFFFFICLFIRDRIVCFFFTHFYCFQLYICINWLMDTNWL